MTGPLTFEPPDSTMRYEVLEYVCDGGAVILPSRAMGTRTIRLVLQDRPQGCVYAILHLPGHPHEETLVVDLSEVVVAADGWVAVGRHWAFPSVEAARAATVMQYGTL